MGKVIDMKSKKVDIEIEHRLMDARGTVKTIHCRRVLRDLGNGGDKFVSFGGSIVPVNERIGGYWHGVFYG